MQEINNRPTVTLTPKSPDIGPGAEHAPTPPVSLCGDTLTSPDRRRANNHIFRTRILRLRLAERALIHHGALDQASLLRSVIDEMVADHNRPDLINGEYRP